MAQYCFHSICLHSSTGLAKIAALLQLKRWASVQSLHPQRAISLWHFFLNQTIQFKPANAFLKLSVSYAERFLRNNTKQFKSFTDWTNIFFSILQKTRYQPRDMIASRHQCQDGESLLILFPAPQNMTAILGCSPSARVIIYIVHCLLSR